MVFSRDTKSRKRADRVRNHPTGPDPQQE